MKRLGIILVLLVIIFSGTCYADSETNDVIDAYNDIHLMFNSGLTYNEFRPVYRTANLKYEKYKQKHDKDSKYSNVLIKLIYLDMLYSDIDRTWKYDIYSNSTDIPLVSGSFDIYPRLKNLKKDMWGNYNTKEVLQTYISYQQEKFNDAKRASDDLDKPQISNNVNTNEPLPTIKDAHI